MNKIAPLSLDLLLLLLLIPAHTQLKGIPFLLVLPLFIYLLLALWQPALSSPLPDTFGKRRLLFLVRLFLIFIIISAATLVPAFTNIHNRQVTEPDATGFSPAYAQMHDGAIQVEYGLRYLDEGKNPYAESYAETPLKYFGFSGVEVSTNPAYDYFVYLPGFLMTSFPVYKLFQQFDLAYDQRLLYVLAYIGVILLLPALGKTAVSKLTLLIAIGLNPLLTGPVIIGMNDVIIIFFMLLTLITIQRQRYLPSAIAFGLACTFKQSAWLFAPFYALLLYQQLPLKQTVRYLLVVGGITLAALLPFALWSMPDFITDVFAYPSGAVESNYPIRGYTVGVLLVGSGVINSPLDPFPFGVLQLIVGLPLLFLLLRYQWQQGGIGTLCLCAGSFIFGLGLVSRFFQDNYVGFVITFIVLGVLLRYFEQEEIYYCRGAIPHDAP